jgi:hypothetical protein
MERVREEGQRGSLGSGPKGSSMLFKQGSTTQLHAREDTLIWSCSARVDRGFAEDSKTSRSSKCSAIGNKFGCTVFTRTSTASCIKVQT